MSRQPGELIDLAKVAIPSRARTGARWIDKDARRLTCNHEGCETEATTIHLVPNVVDVEHVEAACIAHDPGGYWFNVTELRRSDPMSWLGHLANKRGNGVQALLRWMYPGW